MIKAKLIRILEKPGFRFIRSSNIRSSGIESGKFCPETTEPDCTLAGGEWRGLTGTTSELNTLYPAHANFNDEIDFEFHGTCTDDAHDNRIDCENDGAIWRAGHRGRIPALFNDYFQLSAVNPLPPNDIASIETEIEIEITVGGGEFLGSFPYNQTFPVTDVGNLEFVNTLWDSSGSNTFDDYDGFAGETLNVVVSDLRFVDDPPYTGSLDRSIKGRFASSDSVTWAGLPVPPFYIFFWDGLAIGNTGQWRRCETNGNHIDDCHVDEFGLPDTHEVGMSTIRLMRITAIEFSFNDGDEFTFDFDSANVTLSAPNPPTGASHATIEATFPAAAFQLDADSIRVSYEIDNNYLTGDRDVPNFQVDEAGTIDIRELADPVVTLRMRYYPVLPDWAFENGWHNSIVMAYSPDYLPGQGGDPDVACVGVCLELTDFPGIDNNKIAILLSAGQHDWNDDNGNGLFDDVDDIFDGENGTFDDDTFEGRRSTGRDNIIILRPLPN